MLRFALSIILAELKNYSQNNFGFEKKNSFTALVIFRLSNRIFKLCKSCACSGCLKASFQVFATRHSSSVKVENGGDH